MIELTYIKRYVEKGFNIDDIKKQSRKPEYVKARTLYFSLCKHYTRHNITYLAKDFNKNHASVCHCVNNLHDKHLKKCDKYKNLFNNFDILNLNRLNKFSVEDVDNIQDLQFKNNNLNIKNEELKAELNELKKISENDDLMYLISRFDKLTEDKQQKFLIRTDAILNMMK